VAQRVGGGIALLFHDHGTRRGLVVSSTPRPHFTPGKDPVPILQKAGWVPGPVWTGGKSRPHRDFFVAILLPFAQYTTCLLIPKLTISYESGPVCTPKLLAALSVMLGVGDCPLFFVAH
jgi:hypothetical protein